MWYFNPTASAYPATIFVAPITCFKSTTIVVYWFTEVLEKISTPSTNKKKLIGEPVVLHNEIFVITAVVDEGAVYRVAEDVAKDPLDIAFKVVVGIYFSPIK
jgi:hypothetical protein